MSETLEKRDGWSLGSLRKKKRVLAGNIEALVAGKGEEAMKEMDFREIE